MRSDIQAFRDLVEDYQARFRGPNLEPFELSAPYDLSPELGIPKIECPTSWPEGWPHSGRAGIYSLFGEELQAVYIGKASLRNTLVSRLGSYFSYDKPHKTCRLNHAWKCRPRYLITIAVPEESRFEAPALEEFLIIKLRPTDNTAGILRDKDFA